ncbi:tetratricopeptide repeat-containing protein [Sphingorhabdus sp.]|jgi:hypothetical protein|uniref:tetratricopeptide repeat-containing protein n=1 Tax=Sphingorhabdus sp. TaxID=1902408 RepID=UPI0035AE0D0C
MQSDALKTILALARAGATSRAWEAFVAAGFDRREADFHALTLKGRLLKDRARQAPANARAALFVEAGAAYERAAAVGEESYPLINAAAMAVQAGDRAKAGLLAGRVLHLIESGAERGETPYWGKATHAEALLLLGRVDDARACLASAVALAPQAWEDHAVTLRQFALILGELEQDSDWLDRYRPPPVMHFNGILGIAADDGAAHDAIGAAVAAIAPGFAYGALAAGADIIAAEAVLREGAELHVVLPSEREDFRASSVTPLGADWEHRFDRLLSHAESVAICDSDEGTSTAGVALAELHAMGLAVEKADQLQTRAVALRIEPAHRPALGDPWLHSGRPIHHVAVTALLDSAVARLPEGKLKFDVALDGGPPFSFDTIEEAVAAIRSSGQEMAALDCRTGDQIRVRTLLSHSNYGMIAATRSAALALLATGLASRIETIGELGTAEGPLEICLAALAGTDG